MTVTATVKTQTQTFPASTVAGGWQFQVFAAGGELVHNVIVDSTSADLAITSPGDYSVTVQRVDSANAGLGGVASATFTIVAPATVTLDVAESVTVVVS